MSVHPSSHPKRPTGAKGEPTQDRAHSIPIADELNAARSLQQAQRDLLRTAQLAVAGQLVGGITHDLRQPLTALHVNLEVALHVLRLSLPDLPTALAALEDALGDARVLRDSLQVLQDLVTRREPRRTEVAMDAVVREVARLVRNEAISRGVALETAIGARLPRVRADPMMLREAILSLMLDALENVEGASGDGGGRRVAIGARAVENAVELTVTHRRRDDGHAEDTWAMSVARSVAEAHGGTVEIEVHPASGLTVRTTWPVSEEEIALQQ